MRHSSLRLFALRFSGQHLLDLSFSDLHLLVGSWFRLEPVACQGLPSPPLSPWQGSWERLCRGCPGALALGLTVLVASGGGLGVARAEPRTITVEAGDTLEQLALQQGVSLEALQVLNGIRDPRTLQIGQRLLLPNRPSLAGAVGPVAAPAANPAPSARKAPEPLGPVEPPVDGTGLAASAALLLSPAERRDRAELALREQSGQARWKWFNRTAVDWAGWKLTTSGARFTLVKASDADLGVSRGAASAVAVQCETLRQTWRVNGQWLPWGAAAPGSVGQRIVLDLCSNTLNDPAVPLPPPLATSPATSPATFLATPVTTAPGGSPAGSPTKPGAAAPAR